MQKNTILCVDDENDNVEALERLFRKKYTVLKSTSAIEALKILDQRQESISVIITDQRMPEMTGVEFLEKTIEKFPDTSRILLTGYTDLESVIAAVNKGQIFRYITKPWDPLDLSNTVDQACSRFLLTQELKLKNKELEKAYLDLKGLDVAKNNFMILINHELKTPLTSILSFSALLGESKLDDEQKLMLNRIKMNAEKLKSLVDDVLLIVRSETQQLKMDLQSNIVNKVEENISPELQKLFQQKGLKLINQMESTPCLCDIRLIRQALIRLIHNAAKFGIDNSEIILKSEKINNGVRFSVINEGPHISQKIIDRVFNPFYLDEDIMHHSTGMGLGLSLCQSILKQHNSQLRIQNLSSGVSVYFDIQSGNT